MKKYPHHNTVVGYLLFTLIASIIVREFFPALATPLLILAIVCGWTAAALLVSRINTVQRVSVGAMIVVGIAALWYVQKSTGSAPWLTAITQSLPLVTMIMSVGFMKRIALRAISVDAPLPTGFPAYRDTVFTAAVFGGFINISMVIIMGDRLSKNEPLSHQHASAITRAFSTCVNWSPFFAGLAVVISYAPSFSVSTVIWQGIPLALMGVAVILAMAWMQPARTKNFRGFPANWSSLWIPTLLAVVVMVLRYTFEDVALLPIISVAALSVVVVSLVVTDGVSNTAKTFHKHITDDLPLSFNELTLLLGVGVLAAGLVAWVGLGELQWQPPTFDGNAAIVVLALMLLIAMVGVHPVVTIAVASSLLLPVNPNPELLATTLLLGWSLGTLACPLSGLHLVMLGRFGVSSWKGAMNQWPYVAVMFVLGAIWLRMLAAWHQL